MILSVFSLIGGACIKFKLNVMGAANLLEKKICVASKGQK